MTFVLRGGCTAASRFLEFGRRPQTSLVDSWQPTVPCQKKPRLVHIHTVGYIDVNHGTMTDLRCPMHQHMTLYNFTCRGTKLKATLYRNILWGSNNQPFCSRIMHLTCIPYYTLLTMYLRKQAAPHATIDILELRPAVHATNLLKPNWQQINLNSQIVLQTMLLHILTCTWSTIIISLTRNSHTIMHIIKNHEIQLRMMSLVDFSCSYSLR